MAEEEAQQETPAMPTLRQALTDALGLPSETFLLEILLGAETPPVVRCHYYPTPEAMQQAVVVLAEYELVARKAAPPTEIPAPAQPPEEAEDAVP
jgi:hypothetical protein